VGLTLTPKIGDTVKCECGRVFRVDEISGDRQAAGKTLQEGVWGDRQWCPVSRLEVISRPLPSSLDTTSFELKNGVAYSDTVVVHEDGSRERTQWWAPGAYDEGEVES
jgi:hypothetical protein